MIKDRDLFQNLQRHLDKKEYSLIIGARQVGKTTLLQKMYSELKRSLSDVYFISLEDFKILQDINKDYENLFRYASRPANPLLSSDTHRIVILIDEIQYVEKPSNFLKYLYDTYQDNLKIIATGSSAFYLDIKFKDSLAGRKRIFHLKPLSFNEFLSFKEADQLKQELLRIRKEEHYLSRFHSDLLHYFDEYVTFGGYPKIVLENDVDDKKMHIDELITSFLKKDIYESKIEQEQKFYNLCILLANQIGSLVNKNELANTLALNLRTVEKYLFILQKCYYIDLLPPFYRNIRKEITKMPKVYFYDFGIRNKLLNRFYNFNEREDKGQILENYAYIRLKELFVKDQIKFWRTADNNEVDFIITESYGKGIAYEIKFSDTDFRQKTYKKFKEIYPEYSLQCLSYNAKDVGIPILKL